MSKEISNNEHFVRSFARGLRVIQTMGQRSNVQTIASIAESSTLSRSVARRLLHTLQSIGYVETDGKYYWLTPKTLNLGMSYLYSLPYWRNAQFVLEDLRTETNQATSMAVLDGQEIVYTIRIPFSRALASNLTIGDRIPAYCVSMGRILLSNLDKLQLDAYLDHVNLIKFTQKTEISKSHLYEIFSQIQRDGFSWVDGEFDEAICGIAVLIKNTNGQAIGAINVSMPSGSISESIAKTRFLGLLRKAALKIRTSSYDLLPVKPAQK